MSRSAVLAGVCLSAALISGCATRTSHTRPERRGAGEARFQRLGSNGVPLPAGARRIVSLSDAATEDLFAIGAGHQVVAVDQYSTYPAGVPRTRLSALDPNVEAIAEYRPDLVVIAQDADHIESRLAALGVPVLDLGAPANLKGAFAQISTLGGVSEHAAQAASLVTGLRRRVRALVGSVARRRPVLTVYHELDQTHYSASSRTFIGQLYRLLGLRNIADPAAKTSVYPQLSSEAILAADPDLIVLADTVCCAQTTRTVAARPGWRDVAAVKQHHVLAVDDTVASEWGPRIVDFLAEVTTEVKKIEAQR